MQYSKLKKYTSPVQLTVAPDSQRAWRVVREVAVPGPFFGYGR
jgi:hypothetical protein